MKQPLLLTVDDAARALQIGRRLAYTLVMTGQLASVKVGRCRRVPMVALESYVQRLIEETQGDNHAR